LGIDTAPARLLTLLALTSLAFGSCSDLRVKVSVFETLDEARAAGAISDGWVPDGLPRAVNDLREGHLPDGRHWGVFAFPAADEPAIRSLLGQELSTGTLTCDPPRRLEWWPRIVQSPVNLEQIRATGFRIYRAPDSRTYVVNWGQGRAYYWR
jgi:hypothetical protein